MRHVVNELYRHCIDIMTSCPVRKSSERIRKRNAERESKGEREWESARVTGIDISKLQRSWRPLSPIFPLSSTSRKSTYLFLTRENRGRLPESRSRRWKIEYVVPVERPETSWNWSNIQSLLVHARRCAFNTIPERRMFLRWQKIIDSMPIKYVCRVITVQRFLCSTGSLDMRFHVRKCRLDFIDYIAISHLFFFLYLSKFEMNIKWI